MSTNQVLQAFLELIKPAIWTPGATQDCPNSDDSSLNRDLTSTVDSLDSMESEYEDLIQRALVRCGVEGGSLEVVVRKVCSTDDGRDVYAGFLRVMDSADAAGRTLLLKIPAIEQIIRRRLRSSNLQIYSSFMGVWFHTPSAPLADGLRAEN